MKKAIIVSTKQYDQLIKHYDNAMAELKAVSAQFSALQAQGNILNSLEYGEESQEFTEVERLFDIYTSNLKYHPPGVGGNYPKEIWKVLDWFDQQSDDCSRLLESGMIQALYQQQKQWFINGFLYATAILKT